MARPGPENDWQKGYIDSQSLADFENPSRSSSHDAQIIYGDTATGLESGGLNIKHGQNVPPLDLNASWHVGDDRKKLLHPESDDYDEHGGRSRNKSISFDTEATLDNGARHSLQKPLPRTGSLRSVTAADRPNAKKLAPLTFDPVTTKINPFTGEPIRRRPRRQDTASSGLSIMDAFAQSGPASTPVGDAQYASLTSGSTASPPHDEAPTPGSLGDSYLESPSAVTSPAYSPEIEGEPWPTYRSGSVRSTRTLPSRPLSLRRESRRSSKRSVSSSFSPASAFLSRWGRESVNSTAPDPDDEGQSFGIDNGYIVGRQIGYGGFSVVKEAFSFAPDGEKRKHAVKIVRKNLPSKSEAENEKCQQQLEHEVGIWKYLSQHNILALHTVYDTDFATFCVMEINEGGSLYDVVRDSRKSSSKTLDLDLARSFAFQLASALRYLHEDVRIVHRDVKLENCLVARDSKELRLCDFGLADFISSETALDYQSEGVDKSGDLENVPGTLEYAAPEILRINRPMLLPSVDIWAFGVCVFTMVTGDRPFKHSLAPKVVELIMAANWDEDIVRGALGSAEHADDIMALLKGCLDSEPLTRWRISDVLASPWFEGMRDVAAES